jgi:hypothetical protein
VGGNVAVRSLPTAAETELLIAATPLVGVVFTPLEFSPMPPFSPPGA